MSGSKIQTHIVGIGASSGGLAAIRELLHALPAKTGLAILLVQHLDPVHESLLVELLSSETPLKVIQAYDGAVIEPDHVYVIPPGLLMAVKEGEIRLTPLPKRHGVRLPFDFLLTSMAQEYGPLAICVILSGNGADGSVAISSIEEAGGLVLIQDPSEAEFDGMPRNAMSRSIDAQVLPVAKIADAIMDRQRNAASLPPDRNSVVNKANLLEIIQVLKKSTPNDFSSYKYGTLLRRIEKRMAVLNLKDDIKRYIDILRNEDEERQALANDILINFTKFFRDDNLFTFLREKIIPGMLAGKAEDSSLRVWVAGCSTGEEAFSLAMLFLDCIKALKLRIKLQIFASDADSEAVAFAREGQYSEASAASMPPDLLETYFIRNEKGYCVAPQLRACVIFAVQNILTDPPFSKIDLVSCRNVLIYLNAEAQAKVLALFGFALRESGILVLGKSETIGRLDDRFKLIGKSERVYQRISHRGYGDFQFNMTSSDAVHVPAIANRRIVAARQNVFAEVVSNALLGRYVPATILINRRYEYLYLIGPTERFLKIAAGPASLDLFAITPKSLHSKLRSAIFCASQDQKKAVVSGSTIRYDEKDHRFSIHVEPLLHQGEQLFLICFMEEGPDLARPTRPVGGQIDINRVSELEQELEETRAELNSSIRNLELSSEEQKIITAEALSLSEEYQSANEELVTSKEELQSLNEELTALNTQLHETLERQRAISNDLENVLYSTDVPTLFLDRALNIRFFTPATRLLFNVIPSDIGRPFSDISMLMDDPDLQPDAIAALKLGGLIDKEIAARDGRWYIRRIKPFRTGQGMTEGVVITFLDMSSQRQLSEDREHAKRSAELATAAKSHFLAAVSHDLRQPLQTLKLLQGLLESSVENDQSRLLVKRMEDTLASMSGLLDTVLDINRIEAGIVQVKPESFAIASILQRLVKDIAYQAQAKGLELRIVQSSLAVATDPRLLEQIVRNLLSNAVKYTRTGKILVGCRPRGRKVRFEIWDTGIGIPKKELESVFEDYHRLEPRSGMASQGVGLGLSIVKRLSDLLDLNVQVRSQLERGSVFSIDIERADDSEVLVSIPPSVRQHVREESVAPASILVIEDEDATRDLLKIGLEKGGHIVTVTRNADEAVKAVRHMGHRPDLILADYNLPHGSDGLEAIAEIRSILGRKIPALVLTGDISSRALKNYAKQQIPHITKPTKLPELVAAIHHLLSHAQETNLTKAPSTAEAASRGCVEIIDDDPGVRENVEAIFAGIGFFVVSYTSAEDYLARHSVQHSTCILIDAYLPGMDGLQLLKLLKERGCRSPIVVITGHSDVSMAVEAMKHGAIDFIEKPFSAEEIQASVQTAFELLESNDQHTNRREAARTKLGQLTQRQSQILARIVAGEPNKIIAAEMKLSQRTIENHRASIMRRTGSTSLSMLLRLVATAEI